MSDPGWLSMMQEQAAAAREQSPIERAMQRLGVTVREAREDEIRIQRRAGNWHVDWLSPGGWGEGFAHDDDDWPRALENQWAFPVLVAVDFAARTYVFFFRGRFVLAMLRSGDDLSERLPEVSELVEGMPELEVRVHEERLGALLDSLPDSAGKQEAIALCDGRRVLAERDARHASLAERFGAVEVRFLPIPDESMSIVPGDAWEADVAIMLASEPGEEPDLVAARDVQTLVHLLHWHRLEASWVGPIGMSLRLHVLLVRGQWVLAHCPDLTVPPHLEDPGASGEDSALFTVELGQWLALRLDAEPEYAEERPRPDFQALLAELPDDGDARRLVEDRVGPAPAATARARREHIPERVRHEVWRRDEGRCADCGSRERLEFDHIIPWSRGGSNTPRNLRLLCEPCNRRKAARV